MTFFNIKAAQDKEIVVLAKSERIVNILSEDLDSDSSSIADISVRAGVPPFKKTSNLSVIASSLVSRFLCN